MVAAIGAQALGPRVIVKLRVLHLLVLHVAEGRGRPWRNVCSYYVLDNLSDNYPTLFDLFIMIAIDQ
jgi:hypothetical protein